MAELFSLPGEQVFDANGDPLAGAKLYTYVTGTATPLSTYTDDALAVAQANPVVADSAGRFPAIYLGNADYKMILKTSADVTVATWDPVHGGPANPLFSSISAKSGNYTLLTADNGKLLPFTATGTLTLLTAASVGSTYRIGVVNAGAGIVTVARAGGDTIDGGLTSVKLAPGQGVFLQSDGTSKWYTVGRDGRGKGANVASATTLPLGEDGNFYHVTGTTTITGIEPRPQGFEVTLVFDGALTLTYNATSFILPDSTDLAVNVGDVATFVSESDAGNWRMATRTAIGYALRGHIDGVTLSNNATDPNNDIDIAAGVAIADDGTTVMRLASSITKRLDAAWTVGTNQGGLDTGAEANSTGYHVWLIKRMDTGVVDVLFSTSASAPTMPTNYTKKRHIGWFYNTSGGTILTFTQFGDEFWYLDPPLDLSAAAVGTSAALATLTVPTGIRTTAIINVVVNDGAGAGVYLSPTAVNDEAASVSAAPLQQVRRAVSAGDQGAAGLMRITADSSAQIRYRADATTDNLYIATLGFVHPRGRNA